MDNTYDCHYQLKGEMVVILDGTNPPIRLNKHNLQGAIAFIEGDRDAYMTEDAWNRQLHKYRGALAFLEAKTERPPCKTSV